MMSHRERSAIGATRTSAFVVADLQVGSWVSLQGVGALAPTLPAPPISALAPEDSALTFVVPTESPMPSSWRAVEGSWHSFRPPTPSERTAP
jgi:hypothetical protein